MGSPSPSPGRRRNTLLSSYYGLPSNRTFPEEENFSLGTSIGAHGSTFQQDEQSQQNYAIDLIQNASLEKLLSTSIMLRREAREMEGGLQHAVQDSYSKFVTTASVLRDVTKAADNISSDVDGIFSRVEHVARQTKLVNSRLASGREKVEKLEGTRRIIQLLRIAYRLPDWMRQKHAQEETEQAAFRYYVVAPSLKKLSTANEMFMDPFQKVNQAANLIRADLEVKFTIPTETPRTTAYDFENDLNLTLKLFVMLGQDMEVLRNQFFRYLLPFYISIPGDSDFSSETGVNAACRVIQNVSNSLFPQIKSALLSYQRFFPQNQQEFIDWLRPFLDTHLGMKSRKLLIPDGSIDVESIHHLVNLVTSLKEKTQSELFSSDEFSKENQQELSDFRQIIFAILDGILSETHAYLFSNSDLALQSIIMEAGTVVGADDYERLCNHLSDKVDFAINAIRTGAATLEQALSINDPQQDDSLLTESTMLAASTLMETLTKGSLYVSEKISVPRSKLISSRIAFALKASEAFTRSNPLRASMDIIQDYCHYRSQQLIRTLGPAIKHYQLGSQSDTDLTQEIKDVLSILKEIGQDFQLIYGSGIEKSKITKQPPPLKSRSSSSYYHHKSDTLFATNNEFDKLFAPSLVALATGVGASYTTTTAPNETTPFSSTRVLNHIMRKFARGVCERVRRATILKKQGVYQCQVEVEMIYACVEKIVSSCKMSALLLQEIQRQLEDVVDSMQERCVENVKLLSAVDVKKRVGAVAY